MTLGVLGLGMARLAFVPPPAAVHHHANFAVFIDGERLDLSAGRYMQDVESCARDPGSVRPEDRVHLHDGVGDVVHVHHAGATWGHLMANLGLGLGDGYLVTDDGHRYFHGEDGRSLTFVVNGFQVPSVANREIRSRDRLVVVVGPEAPEQVLHTYFPQVAASAATYNETSDPAGCAGAHGPLSLVERLKIAFWGT
jgi:hypothetical protein